MNDIEVLEWFLRVCNEDLYTEISIRCDGRMRKAIENLLKERQSDKERIKDLEEINEAHKKENGKLREENIKLKANHIFTHNEISDKEKAKLYDVIDSSIDKFIESTKPQWEQLMCKDKMTIEEAEEIIDDMYQDRHKIISTINDKGVTIDLNKLDDVKFTNLEFASVRVLREIQGLRRKLENSIPKSLIKEEIEEIEKEFYKLDKEVDIRKPNKTMQDFYEDKERITTMQTLSWVKGILEELLKGE